ncbi:hypothetical protein [Devosia neptuniae]|uniref:hypothetical protein n=1 Tax=Devosia neptuniae TaxID=191302 RepID=UPI0022B07366|nr:hypothetical protein [Devosia neptuniae]MCZ4345521.1 hypothetical protein [Devosia neptuniae]
MKAQVDRMTAELSERFRHYVRDLKVQLWSENGQVEFYTSFRLRRDPRSQEFKLSLPADLGQTDADRAMLVVGIFSLIGQRIRQSISTASQPNAPLARPPDTGPAVVERHRLIAKLQRDLDGLRKIPRKRREAECADEREQTCRALLWELGAGEGDR